MMDFDVRVNFNARQLLKKAAQGKSISQFVLDNAILKDSNKYAPFRDGYLIASGIRHSKPGTGFLKWQTPYARRLYYNPQYNFSKDKNPLAGGLWFERAKAQHKNDWLKAAQRSYGQLFGK